ncbi:MAG TPA: hypothetical protein VM165_06760 [Planctomycetaceae bacterium]|nr:hypothetical protein [Planctomycetaceae bacterium]
MTNACLPSLSALFLLAQEGSVFTVREIDLPSTPLWWLLLFAGSLAIAAWVIWLYRRDTVELAPGWRIWLAALRITALVGLLVVALNPHDRTQKDAFRPSRVGILVDTSLSMRHPAVSASLSGSVPDSDRTTRTQAVGKLLGQSKLIDTLRQQHEVSFFTFDTALSGPHRVFAPTSGQPAAASTEQEPPLKWNELLEPRGLETRLGEAVSELMRQTAGRTLSGLVIISDGASNAGLDAAMVGERAAATKVKLLTVGVGGTEQPVNLLVSDVQVPTEVQKGDAYEITAYIQGQGLQGHEAEIELLLRAAEGEGEPVVVERRQERLLEDGVPVEVKFPRNPDQLGKVHYTVRARLLEKIIEFDQQDNAQTFSVSVFDRPTRVLLVAGGPMRDYQFVRNMLHRHKSIDVDVYLQTASVGTSQESDHLLLAFPATKEELYEYDLVIAFDPDWELLPEDAPAMLKDWVANESGGMIFVAGDVYTPQFAALDSPVAGDGTSDRFGPLKDLYPVVLSSYFTASRFDADTSQPWPIEFTSEGKTAGFLQLTDDTATSAQRWKEFPGFYRCYPTSGPKAGATVYARFSDPRAQGEIPILMAAQFYGQGRTFYLGSAEMWRLRSVSEDDYDRFWIKTVREVVQGRLKRGTKHGLLIPETRRLSLGQTVRIRARLLNGQFQPLDLESVRLEVYDPNGKPMVPPRVMAKDANRPGEYVGDFRASLPGVYRLELPIPDAREQITEEVTVVLPKLEDENVRQNVQLLSQLAELSGGAYFPVQSAEAGIPGLLPNRGELFKVDERLRTLWDRPWVLWVLVGLLSVEWLTRKLLKLS